MNAHESALKNLRGLLPPEVRARWDEEDRQRDKLADLLRVACANVLADLACAIRSPRIARTDLESAQRELLRALSIAAQLDPEITA